MKRNISYLYVGLALLLGFTSSCRKDKNPAAIDPSIKVKINRPSVLVLNEGLFNGNSASIDYLELQPKMTYVANAYAENNSDAKLGDTGNDIKLYGSKIYVVVNNSNKIEVLDARTLKSIQKIDVLQPRFLEVYNGKVYCSAYRISASEAATANRNGFVAVIDTTSLAVTKQIEVGRQPEGLAAYNGKLYVANSGGLDAASIGFDHTISVIDLTSQKEIKKIEIAENLHRMKVSKDGYLYVSTLAIYSPDYTSILEPATLYKIDTKTENIAHDYNLSMSTNYEIYKDKLYGFSNGALKSIDLNTDVVNNDNLLPADVTIKSPYGLNIDSKSGNFYIGDALNYSDLGKMYIISPTKTKLFEQNTGYLPNNFVFLN